MHINIIRVGSTTTLPIKSQYITCLRTVTQSLTTIVLDLATYINANNNKYMYVCICLHVWQHLALSLDGHFFTISMTTCSICSFLLLQTNYIIVVDLIQHSNVQTHTFIIQAVLPMKSENCTKSANLHI